MSEAAESEIQEVPEVDAKIMLAVVQAEMQAIIGDHKAVISALYGLLSDVHYAREEVDERLRKKGFCPGCHRRQKDCMCAPDSDGSGDEEEADNEATEDVDQVTRAEDGSRTITATDGGHVTFDAQNHITSLGFPGIAQSTPGSAIYGCGHGSAHVWVRLGSNQVGSASAYAKGSHYRCAKCGETFSHRYDLERDIFKAMRDEGVSAACTAAHE